MSDLPQNPDQLRAEASEKMGRLLAFALAAVRHMKELEPTLTEEQRAIAQKLKEDLSHVDDEAKVVLILMVHMSQLIELLVLQRQSSKEAYNVGWWGFYRELMTRLTPRQRANLRAILRDMAGSDIPF